MKLCGKNVLVIGLARSGLSAIDFLIEKKSNVFVHDSDEKVVEELKHTLSRCQIVSAVDEKLLEFIDLVVISPGVSIYSEPVKLAKLLNIPVISELQLGTSFVKGKIVAVTGTNGKTTTVSLLEAILNTAKKTNALVGNVGNPITKYISPASQTYVAEVSSFQLEATDFSPDIACILNVSENHLDRHFSFKNYIDTKYKIFEHMKRGGVLVLNADDSELLKLKDEKNIRPKIVWFSNEKVLDGGCIIEGKFCYKRGKKIITICETDKIKLIGRHNLSNILSAICMAVHLKIKTKYVRRAVENFLPIEHRLQFIKKVGDVDYVNDSKSTTPISAVTAVNSFKKPVILILGGSDKGLDYTDMIAEIGSKVKMAVLTGKIAPKLVKCFKKLKLTNYKRLDNFFDAIKGAKECATAGDVVLLSPATASFDTFKNFEERGEAFIKFVEGLE